MSSRMKDKNLPRLTPAIAKAVWQAQQRPSARRVARALNQAGHSIHYTTINRWRAQGWREIKGEHPLHAARAALDSAVPILTGDPSTTAEDVIKHSGADSTSVLASTREQANTSRTDLMVLIFRSGAKLTSHVSQRRPATASQSPSKAAYCSRTC